VVFELVLTQLPWLTPAPIAWGPHPVPHWSANSSL
jgi:hypothetical protein